MVIKTIEERSMFHLELDDGTFVIVNVAVIRSRKDCDANGKIYASIPPVHFIAFKLRLMSSDDR